MTSKIENFTLKFHKIVLYSVEELTQKILKIPGVLRCSIRGNLKASGTKVAMIECNDSDCRSAIEDLLHHEVITLKGDTNMTEETSQPKKIDKFKDSMSGVLGALSDVIADAEASSRKIQSELRIESQAQVDKVKSMGETVKKEIQDTLSTLTKRVEATESRLDRIEKLVEGAIARLDSMDVRLENAAKAMKKN